MSKYLFIYLTNVTSEANYTSYWEPVLYLCNTIRVLKKKFSFKELLIWDSLHWVFWDSVSLYHLLLEQHPWISSSQKLLTQLFHHVLNIMGLLRGFGFCIYLYFGYHAARKTLLSCSFLAWLCSFLETFTQNLCLAVLNTFWKCAEKWLVFFAAGHLVLGSVSCGTARVKCLNKDSWSSRACAMGLEMPEKGLGKWQNQTQQCL